MRTLSIPAFAVTGALLAGCAAYPVYPPAPVVRLTPAQSAALATPQLDQAERDRLARQNAEVQREDQADIEAQRLAAAVPYTYGYPVAPVVPYYGYYGYPAYGGFYPWVPGISLSLGYGVYRGWGGHRHWHGHRGGGRWRR